MATDREGFAGLPYDRQPVTSTLSGAHDWPVAPDQPRYEALPPKVPHSTYRAIAAPLSGTIHPNSRLRDVQRTLRGYAQSARAAARDLGEPDSFQAAALRGKAGGYEEAADLIESALRGGRLRRKWRSRRAD